MIHSCSIAAVFVLLAWLVPLLATGQNRSRSSTEKDFDAVGLALSDSTYRDEDEAVIFYLEKILDLTNATTYWQ